MKDVCNDTDINDARNKDIYNYDTPDRSVAKGTHHVLNALVNAPPSSHNLIVYSDIRILRKIYPVYIKSLLENNEIVLILAYYDHPSNIRQILNGDNKNDGKIDIERFVHDGSLFIVDSIMSYFGLDHKHEMNNGGNGHNLLSLVTKLLNHGTKNNKNGITIFSDMGSFFHFGSDFYQGDYDSGDGNGLVHRLFEYERSIPSRYKELEIKKICLYHQNDYELHFKSNRQKAELLDCHNQRILIMDNNNNKNNNNH